MADDLFGATERDEALSVQPVEPENFRENDTEHNSSDDLSDNSSNLSDDSSNDPSDNSLNNSLNNSSNNLSNDSSAAAPANSDKKNDNTVKNALEWLDSVTVAVVTVILLFTFVFRVVGIVGPSMQNTCFEGDRIIISNAFYTPKCGDVVVISRNYTNAYSDISESQEPIIKRVIATEGMTVDIDFATGTVYVDGEELKEDYIKTPTTRQYDMTFPLRVGENQIFVLGDNRNESLDSRDKRIGLVDKRYILGKALLRVYRVPERRNSVTDMFGVVS